MRLQSNRTIIDPGQLTSEERAFLSIACSCESKGTQPSAAVAMKEALWSLSKHDDLCKNVLRSYANVLSTSFCETLEPHVEKLKRRAEDLLPPRPEANNISWQELVRPNLERLFGEAVLFKMQLEACVGSNIFFWPEHGQTFHSDHISAVDFVQEGQTASDLVAYSIFPGLLVNVGHAVIVRKADVVTQWRPMEVSD